MSFSPTQRKHQLYAGTALVLIGAVLFIAGLVEPSGNIIVIGGLIAGAGQLMRVFAE